MTFMDWVEKSRERYQREPPLRATRQSAQAFWRGGIRRTIEPRLGTPIWNHGDWDVLLVLDACRTDLLQSVLDEYPELPDETGRMWSVGSCSIDWIRRTFNEHPQHAHQAGYITGNPFTNHDDPGTKSADLTTSDFAYLDTAYKTAWQGIGNGIETVPPNELTDRAIDAWRRKRELGMNQLVVHYMQPHEPFRSRPEWGNGDHKLLKNLIDKDETAGPSVYPKLEAGDISLDEFWTVYQDNLRWVLDDITSRLLENCDARVAITADHGNGLGEKGTWHHPPGSVARPIRRVPWLEVEATDEHTLSPQISERATDAGSREQLEALGYR